MLRNPARAGRDACGRWSRERRPASPLAVALAAALSLACPQAEPPPLPPPPAAALVDGAPILLAAVQREVDRLRSQRLQEPRRGGLPSALAPERPLPPAAGDSLSLARAVLGPLVDEKLLAARGRALGIQVSEAEVQRETDALAEAARAAGQLLAERLAQDGVTEAQLHDQTRDRLLAERAMARELREQAPDRPAPAELKAYEAAHRGELEVPPQVHALHLFTASPDKAKGLLDQLRKGAAFDQLARQSGESPDARRGGDLGFFARGTMPAVFDQSCDALKPGQLSGVVRSPYGYHLFKLLARRPGRRRSAEELRPELERRLFAERRAAAERALLEGLRQKAKISIDEAALATVK